MTWATIKPFKTRIPDPLDPSVTTIMKLDYHLYTPVTGDRIFTKDVIYFQLIQKYAERDKHFVSSTTYCFGSSHNAIRMWYQYVTIHSVTHGIYVNTYYWFRPESNDSKVFSYGNDTNTTKHDLTAKYSTILSEWEEIFTQFLVTTKVSLRTVILRSSSSGTTNHMDMKLFISLSVLIIPITWLVP